MSNATSQANWEILLVEDDEDARSVLSSILQNHEVSVTMATTAEEALSQLKTSKPTLVIIDLGLPKMNGWELISAMRSQPALADIPAVAITAYHSNRVAQKAIEAGFVAYFPKPISLKMFVEDLTNILEGRR